MHKSLPLGALALSFVVATGAAGQSLRGSPASIDRMYRQAVQHDLDFYRTSSGVRNAANSGTLVRMSGNADYQLHQVSQPYVLPSTRTFVQRLAAQYRSYCGERLVVTSATRPQSQQLANSTAKTVHPTGMAIDLRKPTRTRCLNWLRNTLSSLEGRGVIEATEERNPPHFHVAVFPEPYRRYVGNEGNDGSAASNTRLASTSTSRNQAARAAADPQTYRVRRGDSLWTIARRTNVSVDRLKSANSLRSSRIVAGQTLVIPG